MIAPYFSVITPSWNQGRYLEGCIASVAAQRWSRVEHWVVDNCSTDETVEVLRAHPQVHTLVEPDGGQSEALNKGFARAKGEVIAWLNADDRYLPGAFDRVAEAFRDPSVHVVFGHAIARDETSGAERLQRAYFKERFDYLVWKGNKLHQPSVFFRRKALLDVGPLREDLHYVMDIELWWRLSAHYAFHPIPEPLSLQLYHPAAKTVRHAERFIEERRRVFGPLLRKHYGRGAWKRLPELHRNMARRYLTLAETPGASSSLAARAFLTYPPVLFRPRFWKILGQLIGPAPTSPSMESPCR